MTTLIPEELIRQMFNAYNLATGFGVPFNVAWERMMWDSAQMGLTAEMITLVVADRLKAIKRGDRKPACVMPRNLFCGDDVINECLVEAHALMALKRKIIIDPARASVLQASGRAADHGEQAKEPVLCGQALGKALTELRKVVG